MSLLVRLDRLKTQKDGMLLDIESWSPQSIRSRPLAQQWSAIEILDHLVRTEVAILASARKGILKPHRIGLSDTLRTRFLEAVFRSDRKVKVPPAATQILPGPNLELPEIVRCWNNSHRDLFDFIATGPESLLKEGIFRHPVAGWMGMAEILDFLSVHIVHHKHQLARLRAGASEYASR